MVAVLGSTSFQEMTRWASVCWSAALTWNFKIAMQRCSGSDNDCGPIGCPELGEVVASSSTNVGVHFINGTSAPCAGTSGHKIE